MRRWVLIVYACLLAGCSEADLRTFQDIAGDVSETALAEGQAFIENEGAALLEEAESVISTQVSDIFEEKVEDKVLFPPYDSCLGSASKLTSVPEGNRLIYDQGFAKAEYVCNRVNGLFSSSVILFGTREGNILRPADFEVEVISGIEHRFISDFTGLAQIEVTMVINGNVGAAAGSGLAIPDHEDVLLAFLPLDEYLALIDVSKSFVLQTFGGLSINGFIYIDRDSSREEIESNIGGYGASFPIPPNSQENTYTSKEVKIVISVPVIEGEEYYIGTGIKFNSEVLRLGNNVLESN